MIDIYLNVKYSENFLTHQCKTNCWKTSHRYGKIVKKKNETIWLQLDVN